MSTYNQPARGYYSIVQYVPDIERTEGANIGVVLFCPERQFLRTRLAKSNQRIRRFFGPEKEIELDLDRIKATKQAFHDRVAFEGARITTVEEFRQFIASRGNHLLLTEPRPIKVFQPEEDLKMLFLRLVGTGGTQGAAEMRRHIERLRQRFEEHLAERGVMERVERNVTVEIPTLGRQVTFPYGYQNGQKNVVQTVIFGSDSNRNVNRACVLAMEGYDLQKHGIRLNVLARFCDDGVDQVRRTLEEMNVALHTADELDNFVQEIKKTAH